VSLSVDDVRDSFVSNGFIVDQSHSWTWMEPSFTSFQIHDSTSDRVLLVLVYSDSTAAQTAHAQALAHEPDNTTGMPGNPHLVEGYGPSIWIGNVALVESTEPELDRIFRARLDSANGVEVDTNLAWEHTVSTRAVDFDFQQALAPAGVDNL
jgi:hypothetical protein